MSPPTPMDAATTLRSPGIVLRSWEAGDVDDVFRACQDPEIQRWTTVPVPYTRDHAHDFVTSTPLRWSAGQPSFAVVDETTDSVLASIGFVGPQHDSVAEIGFWVAPWARGRGVASAATTAVCTWAFDTLGMHRVEWMAEVGNLGSKAVAAKCGFSFEGTLRGRGMQRGSHIDLWIAGLLATDRRP